MLRVVVYPGINGDIHLEKNSTRFSEISLQERNPRSGICGSRACWLQDFDLGSSVSREKALEVAKAQVQAIQKRISEKLGSTFCTVG
jgi:hypothetical protein